MTKKDIEAADANAKFKVDNAAVAATTEDNLKAEKSTSYGSLGQTFKTKQSLIESSLLPGTEVMDVKKFWLITTFEYESIDEINGDVTLKVFTKWYWKSNVVLKVITDSKETRFEKELESAFFPVNPSHPFTNLIVIEKMTDLSRASSEKAHNDTFYINFAQKVYRATIRTQLNFRRYPFDRHNIHAILAVRKNKGEKSEWKLEENLPEYLKENNKRIPSVNFYPEDHNIVNLKVQWTDKHDEFENVDPVVFTPLKKNNKPDKPVLSLRLQRKPASAYANVILPTFTIISIVLMSIILAEEKVDSLKSIGIGLLTLVTSQVALSNKLPKKTYVTYAHMYIFFAYFYLFMLGVLLTSLSQYSKSGTGVDNDERVFEVLIGTVPFAGVWVLVHGIIFLDYILFNCRFLQYLFREEWKNEIPPIQNFPSLENKSE